MTIYHSIERSERKLGMKLQRGREDEERMRNMEVGKREMWRGKERGRDSCHEKSIFLIKKRKLLQAGSQQYNLVSVSF